MPFYRYGVPGSDHMAHLNFGRKAGPKACQEARFPEDDHRVGPMCSRPSTALCDAPGCDKPICELHRTRHATNANTDFCSEHKELAVKAPE